MKKMEKVPPLILALLIIDITLGSAYLFYFALGEPFERIETLLDVDGEKSIPAWFSSAQLFCIAALGGLFFYRYYQRTHHISWVLLILPLGFLLLSMDEIVQMHEYLGSKSDGVFFETGSRKESFFHITGIWMFLLGIPFLAGFLFWAYLIREHFAVVPGSLAKFIAGMLVLLSGALVLEGLANFAAETESLEYVLTACSEETLEMVGATIIFWSMYDLNRKHISISP